MDLDKALRRERVGLYPFTMQGLYATGGRRIAGVRQFGGDRAEVQLTERLCDAGVTADPAKIVVGPFIAGAMGL